MLITQENLFSLIDKGFCFDEDINNIVDMLDEIVKKYEMITETKKEWEIWDHVPYLGYRLSYRLYFNKPLPNNIFDEIEKVTKFAKERRIKVEPFGYFFSEYKNTGSMAIYSIYEDERRKLK